MNNTSALYEVKFEPPISLPDLPEGMVRLVYHVRKRPGAFPQSPMVGWCYVKAELISDPWYQPFLEAEAIKSAEVFWQTGVSIVDS